MTIPTLQSIAHVLLDESKCLEYLINSGIVESETVCERCGGPTTLRTKLFQCNKKSCRAKRSIFRNTFFANSRMKCHQVMMLGYLWLADCSRTTMLHQTGHDTKTVTAYSKFFRQLVATALETDDTMVGGEGITVEIDETKMGNLLIQVKENTIEAIVSMVRGFL
jgi:hypothetical protein